MFCPVYIPIGVPTFDQKAAAEMFSVSAGLLRAIDPSFEVPEGVLLGTEQLCDYLENLTPDLIVVQNITFANGAYMAEVIRRFDCPVLLWTPAEPFPDTGRLKLNALTGAFSAANTLTVNGKSFSYVYGDPADEKTKQALKAVCDAARVKKAMRSLNLLQVGHTPQGFGFGRALDSEIQQAFGVKLLSIEARELIDKAKSYSEAEVLPFLKDAKTRICGLEMIEQKNVSDFARLYKAYSDFVKENKVGALSSRCWPDYFTAFGTPVCAVLSILGDLGVPAACEADTYGALSMYIAQYLTKRPAFFGDPAALHEEENTITFWHCGMAACSLARTDTGAVAGVHCNRRIGPTLEFGCQAAEKATILRIGKDADGKFRILTAAAEILDRPQQYAGTSLVARLSYNALDFVKKAVEYGWEPHYAVAMGDIAETVKCLGKMLGIEVFCF